MESTDISDRSFEELLEIAFLALDFRLYEQSGALMRSLHRLRPGKPYPRIGQALIEYAQGHVVGAIADLRAVLADFPDAVYTRALLARLLKETGEDGWEALARETLERTQVSDAADLARSVLGLPAPSDESARASVSEPTEPVSMMDSFRGRRG